MSVEWSEPKRYVGMPDTEHKDLCSEVISFFSGVGQIDGVPRSDTEHLIRGHWKKFVYKSLISYSHDRNQAVSSHIDCIQDDLYEASMHNAIGNIDAMELTIVWRIKPYIEFQKEFGGRWRVRSRYAIVDALANDLIIKPTNDA